MAKLSIASAYPMLPIAELASSVVKFRVAPIIPIPVFIFNYLMCMANFRINWTLVLAPAAEKDSVQWQGYLELKRQSTCDRSYLDSGNDNICILSI